MRIEEWALNQEELKKLSKGFGMNKDADEIHECSKYGGLERLEEELYMLKKYVINSLIDNFEEISQFEVGFYKGKLDAIDEIDDYIKSMFKYGNATLG